MIGHLRGRLLSVRPECVQLSETGSEPDWFPVTTVRTSYLGELCEHELGHRDVALRAYELNPHSPHQHAAGTQLWARVHPEDVVLLDPDAGA